jgi:hypothetical protein
MKIYIPVGTTASGKTTKCREWISNNQPAVLVEADALRTIFFKEYTFNPKLENIILRILESCVMHWLNIGFNVAVDDAVFFLTKRQREYFVYENILPTDEVIWDFLPVPTDNEVRERRKNSNRGISLDEWVKIKNRHAEELEK